MNTPMNHGKGLMAAIILGLCTTATETGAEQLDLYLLIGQSNMAGRGVVTPEDRKESDRVLALNKDNKWVPAADPIHFDKKQAGVGPGRTFGLVMAKADQSARIGLIPCAVGGTSIRKWKPGAKDGNTGTHPYDDMRTRLKVALQSGTVKGILWHQGESDGKMGESGLYEPALVELIKRVRADCGDPSIPFLIGQLGQFEGRPWSEGRKKVDAAHRAVAGAVAHCAFVSSEGLTDKGDLTHFSAAAARALGARYGRAMLEIQTRTR